MAHGHSQQGGFNLRSLEKDVAAGPSCGRGPSVSIPKMSSWPVPHKDQGFFSVFIAHSLRGCRVAAWTPKKPSNHQAPPSSLKDFT